MSYVIDPASLQIIPKYPSYPYPVNVKTPLLRTLAAALSPSFFVITGGNSNCITYDGFGKGATNSNTTVEDYTNFDLAASEITEQSYMSSYCKSTDCPCFDWRKVSSSSNNAGCRVALSGEVVSGDKDGYAAYTPKGCNNVPDGFKCNEASHCDSGAGYDHTGADSLEACAASCKSTNCPCFDFRKVSSSSNNAGCRVAKLGTVKPDKSGYTAFTPASLLV